MGHESSQHSVVRMNRRELLGTATALIGGAVVGVAGDALAREAPKPAAAAAAGPNLSPPVVQVAGGKLRGLDRKVLLIVTGEFGRGPRIEHQKGTATGVTQPGRDHWPSAMSVLVSGGGLRVGQVVGSTDKKGEHPKDRPLTPMDLWATMFRHLGIDWLGTNFLDHSGRPLAILPSGEAIRELA